MMIREASVVSVGEPTAGLTSDPDSVEFQSTRMERLRRSFEESDAPAARNSSGRRFWRGATQSADFVLARCVHALPVLGRLLRARALKSAIDRIVRAVEVGEPLAVAFGLAVDTEEDLVVSRCLRQARDAVWDGLDPIYAFEDCGLLAREIAAEFAVDETGASIVLRLKQLSAVIGIQVKEAVARARITTGAAILVGLAIAATMVGL